MMLNQLRKFSFSFCLSKSKFEYSFEIIKKLCQIQYNGKTEIGRFVVNVSKNSKLALIPVPLKSACDIALVISLV